MNYELSKGNYKIWDKKKLRNNFRFSIRNNNFVA